jgi:hypothetical protein
MVFPSPAGSIRSRGGLRHAEPAAPAELLASASARHLRNLGKHISCAEDRSGQPSSRSPSLPAKPGQCGPATGTGSDQPRVTPHTPVVAIGNPTSARELHYTHGLGTGEATVPWPAVWLSLFSSSPLPSPPLFPPSVPPSFSLSLLSSLPPSRSLPLFTYLFPNLPPLPHFFLSLCSWMKRELNWGRGGGEVKTEGVKSAVPVAYSPQADQFWSHSALAHRLMRGGGGGGG